jgi:flagellar secretion chaperone FliS
MNQAAYQHAASAYRTAAVTTSPLTAIVMLYDAALVALARSKVDIEAKRLDQAFAHLQRATTILRGLCHNLDFERGGAFAERMRDTYLALILAALHAFNRPDAAAQLQKLIVAITALRDAWVDVRAQLSKQNGSTALK